MTLRQRVIMPRLVNLDYSTDAASKGDVINVPIPAAATAAAVTPSNTPPTPASKAPTVIQVPLDQWEHSDFHLTDKELGQIEKTKHFLPMQAEEAIKALANSVNQEIWSKYTGIYGYTGTAGTTPFAAAANIVDATNLRKILNKQLCPKSDRRVVLDYDAEANALALAPFRDVSQSSDRSLIIEGEIGRKFGMEWFADDHVPTHTKGTLSNGTDPSAEVDGIHAIGAESVALANTVLTGTLVAGDIISFAGHSQTYVVTALATAAANAIAAVGIAPALTTALADNEVMTLKGSHVVNLAFNKFAFAFATRPLVQTVADLQLGSKMMSMQDPASGIVLRLEVSRQYKQTVWDFDILWGSKLVRPELAARLAG